jgi:hypothetical protein
MREMKAVPRVRITGARWAISGIDVRTALSKGSATNSLIRVKKDFG